MFAASILLLTLTIYLPDICAKGAKSGLMISARILVPSLFPFAVPVLYLINSKVLYKTKRLFLIIFILSLIGGYPIGAKLLRELCDSGRIGIKEAEKYLPFFVNAGPAFIVIAVGKGILCSVTLGYVLLAAHCLTSIILAALFAPEIFKGGQTICQKPETPHNSITKSVKSASDTCLSICAFVVFFSVINEYLLHFSAVFKQLKYLLYITEITTAVSRAESIYLISFLLGFAGISIWMQVYGVAGRLKANFLKFVLIRLFHGGISAAASMLIIRVFRINIAAISSDKQISHRMFYSDFTLTLSLIIMTLLFLISITAKKHSGNLLKDVL